MAVKKFVTPAAMRSRLGFADIADVNTALTAALEGTTVSLGRLLRTEFDNSAITDTFYVGGSQWGASRDRYATRSGAATRRLPPLRTKLLLTRGFVSNNQTTDIRYAENLGDFQSPTAFYRIGTATDDYDATKHVIYDYEAGVLEIVDLDLGDRYVRVTYTAGFNQDDTDATLYKASQVPNWLLESAQLRTMIDIDMNAQLRSEERPETELNFLQRSFDTVIAGKVRYYPAAEKPLTTEGSLYSLTTSSVASGEALTRTSGTVWTSAQTPVDTPIVTWGNMVIYKVDTLTESNQFTLSGQTFTFYDDLGTTAPLAWYSY